MRILFLFASFLVFLAACDMAAMDKPELSLEGLPSVMTVDPYDPPTWPEGRVVNEDGRTIKTGMPVEVIMPTQSQDGFARYEIECLGEVFRHTIVLRWGGEIDPCAGIPAPVAAFTFTVDGLDVTVDASASTGDDLSYAWDFGDGSTGIGEFASHTYAVGGTYIVTLTVIDACGGRISTRSITVVVVDDSDPCELVPNPVSIFTAHVSGRVVAFDGRSSTGEQLTHAWDFGDGNTAGDDPTPFNTYMADGTYTVTHTVTDWCGQSDSSTRTVLIDQDPGFGDYPYVLPAPVPPSGGSGQYTSEGSAEGFYHATGYTLSSVTLTSEIGTLTKGECELTSGQCLIWRGGYVEPGTRVGYYTTQSGERNEIRLVR